ncbi:MAG: MFS transporter [Oscillospiraceae bacterium]|nr:MFS transporter [Oscillospiraceae bacterium]
MSESVITTSNTQKYVKKPEFVMYVASVFFYTMMTGMIGNYRSIYLSDVLQIHKDYISLFNSILPVAGFIINFFISMYIDGRKPSKSGKFRPLITFATVPAGILLVLSFVAPSFLKGNALFAYLLIVALGWAIATNFCGCLNMVANLMTPNLKERDSVISFRSISSAVGNSAPLVVILVLDEIWKNNLALQYIVGAGLCSACGIISMLLAMKLLKERVVCSQTRKNPIIGILDVLSNKYAWAIIISDFVKTFRNIATYMGIYMAVALLGSPSKFLLFGLPTGIGTAVGMLVINFLLKKFNSRVLYIASGIYSVIINTLAFAVGYIYFKHESGILQIVFVIALFLIGLQFGASNLLPTMFQADVLESLELQTKGKRLDASLPFVLGIGTTISGAVAGWIAPQILFDEGSLIGYIRPLETAEGLLYQPQSFETKVALLFFYTIFHGIMMFLAGVPFFFYKLTGQTKEDIHNAVLKQRENL